MQKVNKLKIFGHPCLHCNKMETKRIYCSRLCANRNNRFRNAYSKIGDKNSMFGKKPWNYNNGVWINKSGSRYVKYKNITVNGRYVPEHRLIMEKNLCRKLKPNEVVHHKDGNGLNNKISNLQLMTQCEHLKLHNKEMKRDEKGRYIKKY